MHTALLLLTVLGTEPDADLLKRLTEHQDRLEAQQRNGSLVMTVKAEELDDKGAVEHTTVRTMRVKDHDGVSEQELLKHLEDGKDLTAEKQQELAEEKKKSNGDEKPKGEPKKKRVSFGAASPFSKDQRDKYRFGLFAPSDAHRGLVRIGFEPKNGAEEELLQGDALVDPEKGELVRLTMRPSKLPRMVDHLELVVEYGATTPAGRAVSRIDARGDGGILFIHKYFHVDTTFSDHAFAAAAARATGEGSK